jgi:TetR/AcrR family transcriptional repressor of nem operon
MSNIMRDSVSHDIRHANCPVTRRAELKQASLGRILQAGAARLRREGLAGAAIAPVMEDAGLTHGAFYSHFANKDDLAVAAFRHTFIDNRPRWIGKARDRSWPARVLRLARGYLNPRHRDEVADSCAFSALASDAARGPESFRVAFEQELRRSLNAIGAASLDAQAEHPHYDEAIALMAICVGGLTLSRAVADPVFSERILEVCRGAAAVLAAQADQPPGNPKP